MSRRRPIKCRQNCGTCQNYHPILDSCRKGKSVRNPKIRQEECGGVGEGRMSVKCELYHGNFQNWEKYPIHKAQLVIADIPYNIGANAFGSNPAWYIGGDRHNGESEKAGKEFFPTDFNFNIAEYFHFCNRLLVKAPKERGRAPAMLVRSRLGEWCGFYKSQQQLYARRIMYCEKCGKPLTEEAWAEPEGRIAGG